MHVPPSPLSPACMPHPCRTTLFTPCLSSRSRWLRGSAITGIPSRETSAIQTQPSQPSYARACSGCVRGCACSMQCCMCVQLCMHAPPLIAGNHLAGAYAYTALVACCDACMCMRACCCAPCLGPVTTAPARVRCSSAPVATSARCRAWPLGSARCLPTAPRARALRKCGCSITGRGAIHCPEGTGSP